MPAPRSTAIAVWTEPARSWTINTMQATAGALRRTGAWAGDTAQNFSALLSALMGPAVVSIYAFALWSLANNLGWTNSFIFTTGPLSNWMVWCAISIAVTVAAAILTRHTESGK